MGTACRIYYPWLYSKGIVRLQRGGWMSRKTAWNASFQRQQILMSHLWQGSRRGLEVNHWDQLTGMSGLGWWPNGLVFAMVLGKIMKPWLNPGSICGSIEMPYFFAGQKLYWFVINTSGFSFTCEFFWLILILAIFKWLFQPAFHLLSPIPVSSYSNGKHIYFPLSNISTWTLFQQSCSIEFTKDLIFYGNISEA